MLNLNASQCEQFGRDGFLIVNRLLDEAIVIRLRERFDRLWRGEFETGVMPDEVNWQEGRDAPDVTRQICNGWRADRTIAATVLHEDYGRAAAALAGWPGARVKIDNVLAKPVGARGIGFHQDNAYIPWIRPQMMLTVWIALDDTSAEGGTLQFARGSHRWDTTHPPSRFHGPEDVEAAMREAARREGVEPEIVPVEVPAGGGSFHHGWIWHGSGSNRSGQWRRALAIHYVSSEACFVPRFIGIGTGPIYGRYLRLADDLMDEQHFPVTWTRSGYRTPGLEHWADPRRAAPLRANLHPVAAD